MRTAHFLRTKFAKNSGALKMALSVTLRRQPPSGHHVIVLSGAKMALVLHQIWHQSVNAYFKTSMISAKTFRKNLASVIYA
jgi:hypothetical protein